jgi:U3 small nucleolar ribonucleoprotein protein IMP3
MRQLKYHESKLLKKVDFYNWKTENSRENQVLRTYHLSDRQEYIKYNRLAGVIKKLTTKLSLLHPKDPYRAKLTDKLLEKCYSIGLIDAQRSLSQCDKITVSSFCRRRLPVVMVRMKMAETVKMASQYVEQGHIRVGTDTITDPAFLVTRNMEDFVTWVDSSKIKRKILKYNDKLDDFDLL